MKGGQSYRNTGTTSSFSFLRHSYSKAKLYCSSDSASLGDKDKRCMCTQMSIFKPNGTTHLMTHNKMSTKPESSSPKQAMFKYTS